MDVRAVTRSVPPHWDPDVMGLRVTDYGQVEPRSDGEAVVHLAQSNRLDVQADSGAAVAVVTRLAKAGFRTLCFASSAMVYGDREIVPHRTDEVIPVLTGYAALKLACEGPVLAAGGIVMRLTNLYGPGQSGTSVLSRILSQIPGQGSLMVRTSTPVRDFCWVGDAATAALDLLAAQASGTFNVGQGESLSIGDLARMALGIAGESHRPVESEQSDGPLSVLSVDISETSKACGWVPRMALTDGIRRIIMEAR
jgi:UDP-glucose 4-epimerase